jgi:glycosyltransferase involved in cell wall biosynthesis
LIPAFNSQEWVADTLRSALAQSWERKEIIVVDDGSTDQTLAIARQFESEGVRVVTQGNQGAAAARNKALSLCQGDYIQWLDSDDLLGPDKIALQMAAVEQFRNKRLLISGPFGRFKYRYYRTQFTPTALWCDQSSVDWMIRKLGQNVYMQTATWLVSRELTESAGPWNTQMMVDDDGEYFCRVLLACEGIRFVPDSRVYYRAPWFGTLSHIGRSTKKIEAHWLSMQLHISYLRSLEESERVRVACLRYLQTNLIYFYPEKYKIVEEVERLAMNLGGKLHPPNLSWKYALVRSLFGWRIAKLLQAIIPRLKWWFVKSWDKTLFRVRTRFSRVEL